jgi:Domain of unknown function (DUF4268)
VGDQLFISYRRSDSASATGRIYDRLVSEFGSERVFKDVDSIGFGDFRHTIRAALDACCVVFVVIGANWSDCLGDDGQPRLDNPADPVRLEVEAALSRGTDAIVVPLLVDGASMPRPEALPGSMCDLAYQNAMSIRHDPDFHSDMAKLIGRLRNALADREPDTGDQGDANTPAGAGAGSERAHTTGLLQQLFWTRLLETASRKGSRLHARIAPAPRAWLGAGSGVRGVRWIYTVRQHDTQAELYIDRVDAAENASVFEQLLAHKDEIERTTGQLEWQRLEGKRAFRIRLRMDRGGLNSGQEKWADIIDATVDAMIRMEGAFRPWVVGLVLRNDNRRQPAQGKARGAGRPVLNADRFRAALREMLGEAESNGAVWLDVKAGDLHRRIGGYPGPHHQMANCCAVMRQAILPGDETTNSPPSGNGAALTIRYCFPRRDGGQQGAARE